MTETLPPSLRSVVLTPHVDACPATPDLLRVAVAGYGLYHGDAEAVETRWHEDEPWVRWQCRWYEGDGGHVCHAEIAVSALDALTKTLTEAGHAPKETT